ncbi:hypothetical protein CHUAL_008862 [Chamberlinius hualienensis]
MKSLLFLLIICLWWSTSTSNVISKEVSDDLSISAFSIIQAKDYDENSGGVYETTYCPPTYYYCMTSLNDGDYLRYDHINFDDGANYIIIVYSMNDTSASLRQIEVYLDVMFGDPLVTIYPQNTGSSCSFTEQIKDLNTVPVGFHSIHFVFRSDKPTVNVIDFDYFTFTK